MTCRTEQLDSGRPVDIVPINDAIRYDSIDIDSRDVALGLEAGYSFGARAFRTRENVKKAGEVKHLEGSAHGLGYVEIGRERVVSGRWKGDKWSEDAGLVLFMGIDEVVEGLPFVEEAGTESWSLSYFAEEVMDLGQDEDGMISPGIDCPNFRGGWRIGYPE
jgi:hypothetical protein